MNARTALAPKRWTAALAALAAAACSSGSGTPPVGLNLQVATPPEADNPFSEQVNKFIAVTAEVPGQADSKYVVVQPYSPGMKLNFTPDCTADGCKGIPYGNGIQLRFELWTADLSNPAAPRPVPPVIGRGRTIPFDHQEGGAPLSLKPYVTRTNTLAPAVADNGAFASLDGRIGAASVTLPGNKGQVLLIGGAKALAGKTKLFDPASYGDYTDAVELYDPNERALVTISELAFDNRLKQARAFHGAAAGKDVVVVAGGYIGAQKMTNTVEYIDAKGAVRVNENSNGNLVFARANPTVVHLFDGDNYFLILGGKGETACKTAEGTELDCAGNTWELWHPIHGNLAQGRMNTARWNHAAVRLPGNQGGYVLMIGGENEDGPLGTFEVLQFSSAGGGKISRQGASCDPSVAAFGPCAASKFLWEPLTQGMPVARTLPGAAYAQVPNKGSKLDYRHVYIVGGFEDAAHTKPLARYDIFDLPTGGYLQAVEGGGVAPCSAESCAGFALNVARGAPMVAAVAQGTTEGQVLIAGGAANDTTPLSSAESVYVKAIAAGGLPVISVLQPNPNLASELPAGGVALGSSIALNTGHVLVAGGVGTTDKGLTGQNWLRLWTPQY
jgi:hypothetical protein